MAVRSGCNPTAKILKASIWVRLIMPRRTETIRQKVFLQGKPVQVYDALLNPKKQIAFTKQEATANRRVGGKFTVMDGYISGRNLVLEKARRIVQEWETTEWPDGHPPSRLRISLREKNEGTEVRMVHSGVPSEQVEHYREGWTEYYWKPLQEYFRKQA